MAVLIATLSNKPGYLPDAVASVMAQTRPAVHVWAMDGVQDWGGRYAPSVFYNQIARMADPDDYIAWLSDDDILLPNYVEALAGYLDSHPWINAVYGYSTHVMYDREAGVKSFYRTLPVRLDGATYTRTNEPCGVIDGGQMMVRVKALENFAYPWAPEDNGPNRRIADGVLMNRVAEFCGGIHCVPEMVLENRSTPLSAHTQSRGGARV